MEFHSLLQSCMVFPLDLPLSPTDGDFQNMFYRFAEYKLQVKVEFDLCYCLSLVNCNQSKKQQECGATDGIPFFVAELYGISIRFAIVTYWRGLLEYVLQDCSLQITD